MDIDKEVLIEAEKSGCKKRKVGAVIIDKDRNILTRGHNHRLGGGSCEDSEGNTLASVIHAEVMAIAALGPSDKPEAIYVSHQPCAKCAARIKKARIKIVVVVAGFMKFDIGKPRYSLIPPVATRALASVLTYGAKKYKPNNWKSVDDVDRYWDALYRHLQSAREGELLDQESNLPHLWHALTNLVFIIYINKIDED